MEAEYLDDEAMIALYNQVRAGRRNWPEEIWQSPAALHYAATVLTYWIHNVMGWKGWPEARDKINAVLLEQHHLGPMVEQVLLPEFGDDWLDFEVVLNESIRLSDDADWAVDIADRQERVEAAFAAAFAQVLGDPQGRPALLHRYHRFRNHLLRMWGAFQEAQAEHEQMQRDAAERFWSELHLVRSVRAESSEAWSIVNSQDERMGEIALVWGDPQTYCMIALDDGLVPDAWQQVIWKLEQEVLVDELGSVNYNVWQKNFQGEYYRCTDCGELHSRFDEASGGLGDLPIEGIE